MAGSIRDISERVASSRVKGLLEYVVTCFWKKTIIKRLEGFEVYRIDLQM